MPLDVSFITSWLVHDSWSESYVGARRLAYEVIPAPGMKLSAEECALCQLALVGANHLVEVALYKILLPHAKSTGKVSSLTEALLAEASYYQMLTRWLPAVSGKPIDLKAEPLFSTERLRRRRNETIHKSSALATSEMARSALYSAVEASRALYLHAGIDFPYDDALKMYPQIVEKPFSNVTFP